MKENDDSEQDDVEFRVVERWADDEGSDSEMEELVEELTRQNKLNVVDNDEEKENESPIANQNVVLIL